LDFETRERNHEGVQIPNLIPSTHKMIINSRKNILICHIPTHIFNNDWPFGHVEFGRF
jgi:hypothetical protein